jgi:DNA polymerase III alpha subunit
MPNRVVVEWDKDDCAEIGIVKVDLLGLGMMAVIQDALTLVNGRRSIPVTPVNPAMWHGMESNRLAGPCAMPPSLLLSA